MVFKSTSVRTCHVWDVLYTFLPHKNIIFITDLGFQTTKYTNINIEACRSIAPDIIGPVASWNIHRNVQVRTLKYNVLLYYIHSQWNSFTSVFIQCIYWNNSRPMKDVPSTVLLLLTKSRIETQKSQEVMPYLAWKIRDCELWC